MNPLSVCRVSASLGRRYDALRPGLNPFITVA